MCLAVSTDYRCVTDGRTHTDGQTDGQTDGRTDGRTARRTSCDGILRAMLNIAR